MLGREEIESSEVAQVSGFVRSFAGGAPLEGKITVLENEGLVFYTNLDGIFGPFYYPVGEELTLVFEKKGYRTTQSATFMVPSHGLHHENYLKSISFQVPSTEIFSLFALAMGEKEDINTCQIATTITGLDITMDHAIQGMKGVKAILHPPKQAKTLYFGKLPFFHKTNPIGCRWLTETSADGGVMFLNVPAGNYSLQGQKEGMKSTVVKIKARPGMFINVSPPHGPIMQTLEDTPEQKTKLTR